jgi:hypothetical protein
MTVVATHRRRSVTAKVRTDATEGLDVVCIYVIPAEIPGAFG